MSKSISDLTLEECDEQFDVLLKLYLKHFPEERAKADSGVANYLMELILATVLSGELEHAQQICALIVQTKRLQGEIQPEVLH